MEYYFSIGTNIGDRLKNLYCSTDYLKEHMKIISFSSIYETAPVNMKPGTGSFLNMVIRAESSINSFKMLTIVKNIEKKMGRGEKTLSKNELYEDRVIDIDILLAGNEIINSEDLIIPHKEMIYRAFVLIPLCEIQKDLYHPVYKKPISSFIESITGKKGIVKIDCKNHPF